MNLIRFIVSGDKHFHKMVISITLGSIEVILYA